MPASLSRLSVLTEDRKPVLSPTPGPPCQLRQGDDAGKGSPRAYCSPSPSPAPSPLRELSPSPVSGPPVRAHSNHSNHTKRVPDEIEKRYGAGSAAQLAQPAGHLQAKRSSKNNNKDGENARTTGGSTGTGTGTSAPTTRFPARSGAGEKQCTNCGETDTPQWRGTLCNACALWRRSRGSDRPLPLLFPVRRGRSVTPESESDGESDEESGSGSVSDDDDKRDDGGQGGCGIKVEMERESGEDNGKPRGFWGTRLDQKAIPPHTHSRARPALSPNTNPPKFLRSAQNTDARFPSTPSNPTFECVICAQPTSVVDSGGKLVPGTLVVGRGQSICVSCAEEVRRQRYRSGRGHGHGTVIQSSFAPSPRSTQPSPYGPPYGAGWGQTMTPPHSRTPTVPTTRGNLSYATPMSSETHLPTRIAAIMAQAQAQAQASDEASGGGRKRRATVTANGRDGLDEQFEHVPVPVPVREHERELVSESVPEGVEPSSPSAAGVPHLLESMSVSKGHGRKRSSTLNPQMSLAHRHPQLGDPARGDRTRHGEKRARLDPLPKSTETETETKRGGRDTDPQPCQSRYPRGCPDSDIRSELPGRDEQVTLGWAGMDVELGDLGEKRDFISRASWLYDVLASASSALDAHTHDEQERERPTMRAG